MEEGQGSQAAISGSKPVTRADVICCPGDLILIQNHALWISGSAGGHEADMSLYRWEWRNVFGACLLDEQFTCLQGDNPSISATRKALCLFRLFHKQNVWFVHTDRSC